MRVFIRRFGVIIIVLALAVAAWVYYASTPPKANAYHPRLAWYVDEISSEEFVRPGTEIPPLKNASGNPILVEAIKYGPDGKPPVIAYFRKYPEQAQAKILALLAADDPASNGELQRLLIEEELVRAPTPGNAWVAATSPEGEKLRQPPRDKEGHPATPVSPP